MISPGHFGKALSRLFVYLDSWDAKGRVNDVVGILLLREGTYSQLPQGYAWFQRRDQKTGFDVEGLRAVVAKDRALDPKIFRPQEQGQRFLILVRPSATDSKQGEIF